MDGPVPNPVEIAGVFGQYGGILGVIVAALLAIIIFNMWLGYKRQSKFDDRMLEAVNHSRTAMQTLANAVGRLPCTGKNPRKHHDFDADIFPEEEGGT